MSEEYNLNEEVIDISDMANDINGNDIEQIDQWIEGLSDEELREARDYYAAYSEDSDLIDSYLDTLDKEGLLSLRHRIEENDSDSTNDESRDVKVLKRM